MDRSGAAAATVLVEARDLDTDERSSVYVRVTRPAGQAARERELAAAIAQIHPRARVRSFADDVASALGPQHLIVAHYVGEESPPAAEDPQERPTDGGDQGELFAA